MPEKSKPGRGAPLGRKKLRRFTMTVAVLIVTTGCVRAMQTNAASVEPNAAATLVGDWLGPMPGDSGRCGDAYSELIFRPNGAYSITSKNKEGLGECGGFTTWGVYEARGDVPYFHQRGASPGLRQRIEHSARYQFNGPNALMLQDSGSGRWFTYYRQ